MKVKENPGRVDYSEGFKVNIFTSSNEEREAVVSVFFRVLFLFCIKVTLAQLK